MKPRSIASPWLQMVSTLFAGALISRVGNPNGPIESIIFSSQEVPSVPFQSEIQELVDQHGAEAKTRLVQAMNKAGLEAGSKTRQQALAYIDSLKK